MPRRALGSTGSLIVRPGRAGHGGPPSDCGGTSAALGDSRGRMPRARPAPRASEAPPRGSARRRGGTGASSTGADARSRWVRSRGRTMHRTAGRRGSRRLSPIVWVHARERVERAIWDHPVRPPPLPYLVHPVVELGPLTDLRVTVDAERVAAGAAAEPGVTARGAEPQPAALARDGRMRHAASGVVSLGVGGGPGAPLPRGRGRTVAAP